jgi:hypothetical protein
MSTQIETTRYPRCQDAQATRLGRSLTSALAVVSAIDSVQDTSHMDDVGSCGPFGNAKYRERQGWRLLVSLAFSTPPQAIKTSTDDGLLAPPSGVEAR